MRSVLTTAGENALNGIGPYEVGLNITHFGLAYVGLAEKARVSGTDWVTKLKSMTDLNADENGTILDNIDMIYNVWQTPFYKSDVSGPIGDAMRKSLCAYYRYEYDYANNRNSLVVSYDSNSQFVGMNTDLDEARAADGWSTETTIYGLDDTSLTGPCLSSVYKPGPLKYNENKGTPAETKYSMLNEYVGADGTFYGATVSLFPIKSAHPISATKVVSDDLDQSEIAVRAVNYQLSLPGYISKNGSYMDSLFNSIGNFKFNRIGLYATVDGTTKPILFAIIEMDSEYLDGGVTKYRYDAVIKSRSSGTTDWQHDHQIEYGSYANGGDFFNNAVLYEEAYRSDATAQYMQSLDFHAATAEAIMQLQMQIMDIDNKMTASKMDTVLDIQDRLSTLEATVAEIASRLGI